MEDFDDGLIYEGIAHLAFIESTNSCLLLGHALLFPKGQKNFSNSNESNKFIISAEDVTNTIPKGCSCEKDDKYYNLRLIQGNKEVKTMVKITGGDACRIDSPIMEFLTSKVIIDEDAKLYVNKNIKKSLDLTNLDAFVCIGTLKIYEIDFNSISENEVKVVESKQTAQPHHHNHTSI